VGNNATVCNLHLMRQINAAKRKGARLVVIDPRRVKVAEQAQLHLPVRPGTDVVLAWAIAVELERLGGLDRAFMMSTCSGSTPSWKRHAVTHPNARRRYAELSSTTSVPWRTGTRRPHPR